METTDRVRKQFCVVNFIDKPCNNIDDYVCVHYTWILPHLGWYGAARTASDQNVVVAYIMHQNILDSRKIIETVERRNDPRYCRAHIRYESDSYIDAMNWITKRNGSHKAQEIPETEDTQRKPVLDKKLYGAHHSPVRTVLSKPSVKRPVQQKTDKHMIRNHLSKERETVTPTSCAITSRFSKKDRSTNSKKNPMISGAFIKATATADGDKIKPYTTESNKNQSGHIPMHSTNQKQEKSVFAYIPVRDQSLNISISDKDGSNSISVVEPKVQLQRHSAVSKGIYLKTPFQGRNHLSKERETVTPTSCAITSRCSKQDLSTNKKNPMISGALVKPTATENDDKTKPHTTESNKNQSGNISMQSTNRKQNENQCLTIIPVREQSLCISISDEDESNSISVVEPKVQSQRHSAVSIYLNTPSQETIKVNSTKKSKLDTEKQCSLGGLLGKRVKHTSETVNSKKQILCGSNISNSLDKNQQQISIGNNSHKASREPLKKYQS